jgi:hypothetical protein
MAPMNYQSSNLSSNYGEDAVQRVNVLASCYIVDSGANLKGLHYCTTGAAGTFILLPEKAPTIASDTNPFPGAEWYS